MSAPDVIEQRAEKGEIPASVARKILDDNPRRFYGAIGDLPEIYQIIKNRGLTQIEASANSRHQAAPRFGLDAVSLRRKIIASPAGDVITDPTRFAGNIVIQKRNPGKPGGWIPNPVTDRQLNSGERGCRYSMPM